MANSEMMAWDTVQNIGLLKAENVCAQTLLELYQQLESAIREGAPVWKIDGLEWAINEWKTKRPQGPFLYDGIRVDFARFLNVSLEEAHPIFNSILDRINN
jgi:hypothetical protein